jgi:hypothetical protein
MAPEVTQILGIDRFFGKIANAVIPKLRNLDSYCPTLCGDGRVVNVSQIKHLDGRHKPAATPQMGRG